MKPTLSLFFLLLIVAPLAVASLANAEAQAWVTLAESTDSEGDQAPFESHYDLLRARAESNGTWFAFVLERTDEMALTGRFVIPEPAKIQAKPTLTESASSGQDIPVNPLAPLIAVLLAGC